MIQPSVASVGPPGLCSWREFRSGRDPWTVAVLIAPLEPPRGATYHGQLAKRLVDRIAGQRGSVTRRIRTAIAEAHHWLRRTAVEQRTDISPVAAAIVVLTPAAAILARVGPSSVDELDALQIVRIGPPSMAIQPEPSAAPPSPWLFESERSRGLLGGPTPPAIVWSDRSVGAGAILLIGAWDRMADRAAPAQSLIAGPLSSPTSGPLVSQTSTGAGAAAPTSDTRSGAWVPSVAELRAILEFPAVEQSQRLAKLLPTDCAALLISLERPVRHASFRAAPRTTIRLAGLRASRPAAFRISLPRGPNRLTNGLGRWRSRARKAAPLGSASLPKRHPAPRDGQRADRSGQLLLVAAVAVLLAVALLAAERRPSLRRLGSFAPPSSGSVPAAGHAALAPTAAPLSAEQAERYQAEDAARHIVRLAQLAAVGEASGDPLDVRHLAVADGQVYVLNATRGQVERIVTEGQELILARGQEVAGLTVGNLEHITTFACGEPEHACLALLDTRNRIWLYDGLSAVPMPPLGGPAWRDVRRLAGRGRALYFVDQGRGQIVRARLAAGALIRPEGSAEDWLLQPEALAGVVDLAVSETIYLAFADGRVAHYASGRPASFGVTGLTEPFGHVRAICVADEEEHLLVADRGYGRIVMLNGDGTLLAQLLAPRQPGHPNAVVAAGRFANLQDVSWDGAGRALYILAGATVYRASYP